LFLNLNVELGSSNTIAVINKLQHYISYLGAIAEDCKTLTSSLSTLDFSHIRRLRFNLLISSLNLLLHIVLI